jgi:hypothetical protein
MFDNRERIAVFNNAAHSIVVEVCGQRHTVLLAGSPVSIPLSRTRCGERAVAFARGFNKAGQYIGFATMTQRLDRNPRGGEIRWVVSRLQPITDN